MTTMLDHALCELVRSLTRVSEQVSKILARKYLL